jgi:hypothetical protein
VSLVVLVSDGSVLPLASTPRQAGELMGKSDHAIRDACVRGELPTLSRPNRSGAHWRIPTVHLLDLLGVSYEVVEFNSQTKEPA